MREYATRFLTAFLLLAGLSAGLAAEAAAQQPGEFTGTLTIEGQERNVSGPALAMSGGTGMVLCGPDGILAIVHSGGRVPQPLAVGERGQERGSPVTWQIYLHAPARDVAPLPPEDIPLVPTGTLRIESANPGVAGTADFALHRAVGQPAIGSFQVRFDATPIPAGAEPPRQGPGRYTHWAEVCAASGRS